MRCLTMDMFYMKLDMKSSCKINPSLTISYPLTKQLVLGLTAFKKDTI